jgi:hypothetical protein
VSEMSKVGRHGLGRQIHLERLADDRRARADARFERAAKWAKEHWGLTLYRASPDARGYWHGAWKSGLVLSGAFPGSSFTMRRFVSIGAVQRAIQIPKTRP